MSTKPETLEVPRLGARLAGLGSVFGKTIHDSRRSVAMVGIGIGLLIFFVASLLATQFNTPTSRMEVAVQATQMPVLFRGLLGEPIHVELMGGFLSWRLLNFMPIIVGVWSAMALAGTLGGEGSRGSLEMLMSEPLSRPTIAVEKLVAHVAGMAVAVLVISLITWVATVLFATLPGDEVALAAVLGQLVWVGLVALTAGAVAFALGPLLGRGGAAGVASAFLVGSYIVNGYAEAIPFLESLKPVSIFSWTAGHRPMAGISDWASVAWLAVACVAIMGVGVVVFVRRDLGRTIGFAVPMPQLPLAVAGPATRSFFERLPAALWWGIGLALYVAVFASNGRELARTFGEIPAMQEFVQTLFPGVDINSVSGVLQLVVFNLGTLMMAMVAAALVGGWSTDETERRLEAVLTVPLSRARWALSSAAGVYAALLVTNLFFAAGILLGAAAGGGDAGPAALGVLVAGLYAAALAGIGLAVGGLGWPRLAGAVTGGLALGLFLLDLLGPALKLPDWIVDLALARHLGQPMAGVYGWGGMAVAAGLAVAGALIGAWGLVRRDVRG